MYPSLTGTFSSRLSSRYFSTWRLWGQYIVASVFDFPPSLPMCIFKPNSAKWSWTSSAPLQLCASSSTWHLWTTHVVHHDATTTKFFREKECFLVYVGARQSLRNLVQYQVIIGIVERMSDRVPRDLRHVIDSKNEHTTTRSIFQQFDMNSLQRRRLLTTNQDFRRRRYWRSLRRAKIAWRNLGSTSSGRT